MSTKLAISTQEKQRMEIVNEGIVSGSIWTLIRHEWL